MVSLKVQQTEQEEKERKKKNYSKDAVVQVVRTFISLKKSVKQTNRQNIRYG